MSFTKIYKRYVLLSSRPRPKKEDLAAYEGPVFEMEYKAVRSGLLIFSLVQFFFEVFALDPKNAGLPVFANFWISRALVRMDLRELIPISRPIMLGLRVATFVFLIRCLIGALFALLVF